MNFPDFPSHGSTIHPAQVRPPVTAATATPTGQREPALWTMLSHAERAFFDVPSLAGALSYGPAGETTGATPTVGQQLDIRA
ncbi:MAG: hypothetical protein SFU57_12345 [Gemmatimonadales bacterium]|nr:hypothetical protein [Gemmatimonadales bacterium]MDZ4257276.1 hypothetical protein [Gemmatimonadales bacterium]MDZ4388965.1 hypothetical protein [Gemmatimonadales bacterium]